MRKAVIWSMIFACALGCLVLLSGCSHFSTVQIDSVETFLRNGIVVTNSLTKTTVSARTIWDSKSELSKFAATQTAKTQSTKVGSLNAESSGTNAIASLNALARIAEAVRPTP